MAAFEFTVEWIKTLLALPTNEARLEYLRAHDLADAAGLAALLDYAEGSARHDALHAQAVTGLCETLAATLGAPSIVPRATYLRAQTHLIRDEVPTALALIRTARNEFTALGMAVEALRTDVGHMHALTVLGRYGEALDLGRITLQNATALEETASPEAVRALRVIRAKIHVNQGPALSESGRFDDALAAYAAAATIYAALNMDEDRALVLSNRGVALRYLGRVDEALAVYQEALALVPAAGYFHALLLTNIGDAQLLLGEYSASLGTYTTARDEFAAQGATLDEHLCASHMADAYLALNLYPEAQALYQDVVAALRDTEYHYYLGKALWGLGMAHLAQSALAETETALNEAAEIFASLENTPLQAGVQLEQAALHAATGDPAAAQSVAQEALNLVHDSAWPVQRVYAHLRMADLLLPDVEKAEPHLLAADALLPELTLPHLRYRVLGRLGHVRRQQGRTAEAQQLLASAIASIEMLRTSLADEALRVSFQQDKMTAYEELIKLHLGQATESGTEAGADADALERAFDLIESAKSRALVERLSGVVQAAPGEQADAQQQQIEARLHAIYSALLGAETGDSDAPETRGERAVRLSQLRQRATALENTLLQLRLRNSSLTPQSTAVAPGSFNHALPLARIQSGLAPGVSLISYHCADDEILAFVVTRDDFTVVRRISTPVRVGAALRLLQGQWGHFRTRSALIERHLPRLEQSVRQPLGQLYTELLSPLEAYLSATPVQKLVIVPHGLLHNVPFGALHDGERYLIERMEISQAPSATVLALCQQQPPRATHQVLVLAVADPAIPAVVAEAHAMAAVLPQVHVLLNQEATREELAQHVDECRVLHLACHGLYRADNPIFSALKLHDGWLTAADVTRLDLRGALVVLSACESGRGAVLAGDEMIGLARACLGTGATALVVSQWLVQDDTGAMFMAEWYARLVRGQSAAAALRGAQLAIKSSHPHPYYWAPFVLMGSRSPIFPTGVYDIEQ